MAKVSPKTKTVIQDSGSNQKSLPIYFHSLELERVLCFKTHQKLNLSYSDGIPFQWTVILGDNGVGKTTLLRCLAAMEPHPFKDAKLPAVISRLFLLNSYLFNPWSELESIDKTNAQITASFIYDTNLGNRQDSSEQERALNGSRGAYLMTRLGTQANTTFSHDLNLLSFKCYGYGASRKIGETALTEDFSSNATSSLFSDTESLINAEEWLLQADYAVARSNPKDEKMQQRFDLIRDTLKQILPDVSDIRIRPSNNDKPRPVAEFLTPYGWVSLSSLGLGYKTVIAWTVDLAVRMMARYPESPDPLAEPAVVLVDEIDLHLHPKWQRTIMSFLTERFPKVQFIVTAHSPLVVQAAKDANIVLLRREGDHVVIDNDPEVIDNWRVEQVLTSVFELPTTLPIDIEPLIQRRRKLLAKSTLTRKDEKELKDLEAKIGNLPSAESPADIRAMEIIRKAAKLLDNP